MNKQFTDLYEQIEDVLAEIEEPIEQMTIKECQEAFYDMRQVLNKFIEVYDSVKWEELCDYKQESV